MSNQVWTTVKVQEQITKMESGLDADSSCFHDGNRFFRKADINFQYTKEEQKEIVRCAEDILYFANKYCFAMTDEGITKIDLRDYQKNMLKCFQDNRYVALLAARQTGKCLLFNSKLNIYDKVKHCYMTISIGNLYYMRLEQTRKLTIPEKIKWKLWKLYDKIG